MELARPDGAQGARVKRRVDHALAPGLEESVLLEPHVATGRTALVQVSAVSPRATGGV